MTESILNNATTEAYGKGFERGVRTTLKYLRDEVYGAGIEDTDVWKDYFTSGDNEEDND